MKNIARFLSLGSAAALLLLVAALGSCTATSDSAKITADEARVIANRFMESVQRGGMEPTFLHLYSEPENRCLTNPDMRHHPDSAYQAHVAEVKRALEGQRYYLVMYEPPDIMFGSTWCVFVSGADGSVRAGDGF